MALDREREAQEVQEAGRGEGGDETEDQRQGWKIVNTYTYWAVKQASDHLFNT